jgi:hypothetical protein
MGEVSTIGLDIAKCSLCLRLLQAGIDVAVIFNALRALRK